jgi:hypothetical protein
MLIHVKQHLKRHFYRVLYERCGVSTRLIQQKSEQDKRSPVLHLFFWFYEFLDEEHDEFERFFVTG